MKYIFITGGVVSYVGKGLAAAALGILLEHRGLKAVSTIRSSQCLATNAQLEECTVVLIVDCAGAPAGFP